MGPMALYATCVRNAKVPAVEAVTYANAPYSTTPVHVRLCVQHALAGDALPPSRAPDRLVLRTPAAQTGLLDRLLLPCLRARWGSEGEPRRRIQARQVLPGAPARPDLAAG